MTAHSLVPLLRSEQSGLLDPRRDHVLIGRERHVDDARAGRLPYPQRAIRTAKYLLVVNYHPERMPMGDERQPANGSWSFEVLANDTRATFPDLDAGVTKAWLVLNQKSAAAAPAFRWSFAPRPEIELYDILQDPHQMNNLAAGETKDHEPTRTTITRLRRLLEQELIATGDPRLTGDRQTFERSPFTD